MADLKTKPRKRRKAKPAAPRKVTLRELLAERVVQLTVPSFKVTRREPEFQLYKSWPGQQVGVKLTPRQVARHRKLRQDRVRRIAIISAGP